VAKSLSKRREKLERRLRNKSVLRTLRSDMGARGVMARAPALVSDGGEGETLLHISSLRKMYGMGWNRGRGTGQETALLTLFSAEEAKRAKLHSLYFKWEPRADGTWLRHTLYRASFHPRVLPVGWTEVRRWHDECCRLWVLREAELDRPIVWTPGQEYGPVGVG